MAIKLNQVSVGIIAAATWALVLLAMWRTTPAGLRPIGVTIWFVLLFVALSTGLSLLLDLGKRLFGPKKPEGRAFRHSQRQGLLLGIWLTIILGMSSLRQLSIRDVLLIGLIIIIIEFYIRLT